MKVLLWKENLLSAVHAHRPGADGDLVQAVLKCLPVFHGTSMMWQVCTREAVSDTFTGLPEMAQDTFREVMGISVSVGEHTISIWEQVLILLFYAIIRK